MFNFLTCDAFTCSLHYFALFHKKQTLQIETGRQRDPKESWREETHRSFYPHNTGAFTQRSLYKGAFYIQKVLHREVFTLRCFCRPTSRSFYSQKFLHEEVFTQRTFYTQTRLHTEAFTQRSLYTEERLHTKAFTHSKLLHTQGLLHREAFTQSSFFTHRRFYTEKSFLCGAFSHKRLGAFYTQKLLHKGVFYTESFNTQTRLHTETFTQRSLYTESVYTRKLLHTEKSLHRRAFTQRSFHTKKSLHRESYFYTQKLLHREVFAQRAPLHEVTSWNRQQFFRKNPSQELSGTHLLPKKRLFQQICSKKPKEYTYFWSRSSFSNFHALTAMKWRAEWSGGADEGRQPKNKYS